MHHREIRQDRAEQLLVQYQPQEVLSVSSSLTAIGDMDRSQDGHSCPLCYSTSLSVLLTDCLVITFYKNRAPPYRLFLVLYP